MSKVGKSSRTKSRFVKRLRLAPGCDSTGTATERSFPTPEVRGGGREELPQLQGAAAARAERSYSTFKVRRGGREKIPLVQGKEQRLLEQP